VIGKLIIRRMVTRLVLFVGASLALGYVSKASLNQPRSHGFYRFLSWESILALVLLNFRDFAQWFGDPFCPRQLVSWVLLVGSIVPATWGAHLLRTHGRPTAARDDRQLFEFEKTTQLVTAGVFKCVRHPLYSSLLLLAWGVFLKRPSGPAGVLALCATALLVATAKAEESENRRYFGTAYDAYMRDTKMFIPFIL
jgi:protein-S-isoprenylcysteine O-methyltransferase Ste14